MKKLLSSIFKFPEVIKDINNYLYLKKVVKRESLNSPIWAKNNLRVDWIGRIYTVMNLPPEVTLSPDMPREVWPAYLLDQSKGLNEYLTSLNLHEIIIPEYKEIPDSTSYLLVYSFYFRSLGWGWFLSRSIIWTAIYFIQTRTHFFTNAYAWLISHF